MDDSYGYCKKHNDFKLITQLNIMADDRIIVHLKCGHVRIYQLIASKDDYIEKKEG